MIVTAVTVKVKASFVELFKVATIENHEKSVMEPGNMRFDVLQSQEDPTLFLLYEAYETETAAKAHKQTEHYLKWRDTVADWMAEPRVGVAHSVVAPLDRNRW